MLHKHTHARTHTHTQLVVLGNELLQHILDERSSKRLKARGAYISTTLCSLANAVLCGSFIVTVGFVVRKQRKSAKKMAEWNHCDNDGIRVVCHAHLHNEACYNAWTIQEAPCRYKSAFL
jgi:hypothetical protein